MSDIFVSYAREDQVHAERLARALEKQQWSVWWDRSIPAGKTYDKVIEAAIGAAACVIVIWSEHSVASRWVRIEAEEGANRDILVPIRIDDVEIPLAFRSIQAADLIGWNGASDAPDFMSLVVDIAAVVEGRAPEEGKDESRAEADGGRRVEAGSEPTSGDAAGSRWQEQLLWAIAAIVVGIGIVGLLDFLRSGQPGWWGKLVDEGLVVTRVLPGGAAEHAGIEKGDVVTHLDGTSLDAWDWTRRAEIGDNRILTVERAGQARELQMTFEGPPPVSLWAAVCFFGIAVIILFSCLWPYLETRSPASSLLALFGLTFCLAFLQFPAPHAKAWRLWGSLFPPLLVLGFAFLVHFLLLFPRRRALLDKPWALNFIYFPAVVTAVVFLVEIFLTIGVSWLVFPFSIGYLAVAAVLVTHYFLTATPRERSEQGLNLMLPGVVFGLLPSIPWLLAAFFPLDPLVDLPLVGFYPLTLGLIPITFAFAVVRRPTAAGPA